MNHPDKDEPSLVSGSSVDWLTVSTSNGGYHTCGIQNDGTYQTLWCWGRNNYGQLGDETNTNKYDPRQTGSHRDWVSVSVGTYHTCGLREYLSLRSLWCWGRNDRGQLGNGTIEDENMPILIGTDNDWDMVALGGYHTCGIRDDGAGRMLYCWGDNGSGQLGNGANGPGTNEHSPVLVGTNIDWAAVSGGYVHTCGTRDDGTDTTLWCWGRNVGGQLGDGTNDDSNTPTTAGAEVDWSTVQGGGSHTCGIRDDGTDPTLWCWGSNDQGQLGDGTNIGKNIPTFIP